MKQRLVIIFGIALLFFVVLIGRVIYISLAKGQEYQEEVLDQKTYDSLDIPFERGDIVDRNGNILATSEKVYNLILEPKNILRTDKGKEATKAALIKYFGMEDAKFDECMQNTDSFYKVAMKGLEYADVKAFQEYCDTRDGADVVGVRFEEEYKRKYPNGSLACHLLGYTVSGNVGQGGIEGYYNSYLNGVNGKTYGYLTNDNTVESVTVPAQNGYTVVSTIDLNIQKIIEDNIKEYMQTTGAKKIGVIAMDPDTAEILGMSTSYGYDPNEPMNTDALRNMEVTVTESTEEPSTEEDSSEKGSSEDTIEATTEEQKDPEKIKYDFSSMTDDEFQKAIDGLTSDQTYEALDAVWRNYCISDILEPGSTFKPFTIAGALEDGVVKDGDTFFCKGYEIVAEGTSPIYCHNRSGDGTLTLKQALEQSCNVALMQIAKSEGRETFSKYQDIFNFGNQTGIDLSGEGSGLVYDEEGLNPVELATSSFGQGINVTMIQMAAAFCSLINGGNYYTPHTVRQILDENGSIIENNEPELVRKTISKTTSDLMKQYMAGVVTEGTGSRAAVDGYTIGGKTGTAEKIPRNQGNYVLSFIGFSPVENPQIMLYVAVDEPNVESQSTSGAGALLFHAIMEDLLPYMNVYQSSDEDVTYNGKDEPISSPFEGNVEDSTGEETTEAGSTAEGDTTAEDTGSENVTSEGTTEAVSENGTSEETTSEETTEAKVQDE
ncbi:peptidoglycan D,D-transpeptidase FtsI family protein [Coprococcus sp. HCN-4056]|uniref:peptidoglycan D,D-transpeptidase FtsI family protein n=1 Tax=Coprococcus sp. HCN-4056 TaxID=3134671 RepID=UPI0030BEF00D